MNAIAFSIVFPSRGHFDGLRRAVESCFDLAANPDKVEVIVRIDIDDLGTLDMISDLTGVWPKQNLRFIVGDRLNGYPSIHSFANECAKLSSGKWISSFNDDCWFDTPHWDEKMLEFMRGANRDLFYTTIDRPIDKQSKLYASFAERPRLDFPIISRHLYEKIGCYSPTPAWDWFWNDANENLPKIGELNALGGYVVPGVVVQHAYQRGELYPNYEDEPKVKFHRSPECQAEIKRCMEALK